MKYIYLLVLTITIGIIAVSCSNNPSAPQQQSRVAGKWTVIWDSGDSTTKDIVIDLRGTTILLFDSKMFQGDWKFDKKHREKEFTGVIFTTDSLSDSVKIEIKLEYVNHKMMQGTILITNLKTNQKYEIHFNLYRWKDWHDNDEDEDDDDD